MVHTCPRCQAPIQLGQRFCAHCALPLDPGSLARYQAGAPPVAVQPRQGGCSTAALAVLLVLVGAGLLLGLLLVYLPAPTLPQRAPVAPVPPTALPVSGSSADVAYAAALTQQMQSTAGAFDTLAAEMSAPDQLSPAWKGRIAAPMAQLQANARAAAAITAPPRFASVDRLYKAAMGHYNRAMDLLASGIDTTDPGTMRQAASELTLGQTAMQQANQAFQQAIH